MILASSLLLALFLSSVAVAQGPAPQHSDPNWQASYWNNTTLAGTAVYQRSEANLDYDWGAGSPVPGTVNNDQVRTNYNWARWYSTLAAGRYEVFVYIPDRYSTTANARYWVSHQDGLTLRAVDQSAYSNQWVSLGVYTFRGSNTDYVSLADVTFEPYLSRLIGFDAVKWEPR